jgi:processive 1,2-diacylglycerol beta-glucosyltransferase
VARALAEELDTREGVEYDNIDILDLGNNLMRTAYRDMYAEATQNVPELYSIMYRNFNIEQRFRKFQQFFDRIGSLPLFQRLEQFKPDLVMSLHPLAIEIVDFWRRYRNTSFVHQAVVTDFEGHGQWVNPRMDGYFVGSELSRVYLEEAGIASDKIWVSGIPIMKRFEEEIGKSRARELMGEIMGSEWSGYSEALRRKPLVLFVAGSLQTSEVEAVAERILRQKDFSYLIVTGKNDEVREAFDNKKQELGANMPVKVVGFVDNMHELMSFAHVIISKPGGLTVSEALRKSLPVIVIKPIPGQEQENSDYILENGLGLRANNLELVHYKVRKALERKRYKTMRKNCKEFSFAHSAASVVDAMLQSMTSANE